MAFVSSLLQHEVKERLGTGPEGKEGIKSHAFMAGDAPRTGWPRRRREIAVRCIGRKESRVYKDDGNQRGEASTSPLLRQRVLQTGFDRDVHSTCRQAPQATKKRPGPTYLLDDTPPPPHPMSLH